MKYSVIYLFGLILLTAVNFLLFVSRWAEPTLEKDLAILTLAQMSSLVVGVSIALFFGACIRLINSHSWILLVVYLLLGGLVSWSTTFIAHARLLMDSSIWLVIIGALFIAPLFRQNSEEDTSNDMGQKWQNWTFVALIYFFLALNFFLLVAPFTAHIPSIVQDRGELVFSKLNYSSIDSDRSPVFVLIRRAINLMFPAESLNSSALVSMITVSAALALSAIAARVVWGVAWASIFLIFCATDKWIVGAALASSGLSQPVLLISATALTAIWLATKPSRELKLGESFILGIIIGGSLIFSLYIYSVGRITWIFGCMLIGFILLVRGLIPIRLSSIRHIFLLSWPSILGLYLVLQLAFSGDINLFKTELFASPEPWRMIEHPSKLPQKLRVFTDGDAPIWLGSAFDEDKNLLFYWRRGPIEILEAIKEYFKSLSDMNLVDSYLSLITVAGIFAAFASQSRGHRRGAAIFCCFLVFAYAPMLLTQDFTAYRRGLYTEVAMMLLITGAFATVRQNYRGKLIYMVPALAFAGIKAPLELRPLLTDELHTAMCVACHNEAVLPLKRLVRDPQFTAVQGLELRFLVNPVDLHHDVSSCMDMALKSWEMSTIIPHAKILRGVTGNLTATFEQLNHGEILVLPCSRWKLTGAGRPEMEAACDGKSSFGRFIGRTDQNRFVWWTFIEKS